MGLVWFNPTDERLCLQWLPAIVHLCQGHLERRRQGRLLHLQSIFPDFLTVTLFHSSLLMHWGLFLNLDQVFYIIIKKND